MSDHREKTGSGRADDPKAYSKYPIARVEVSDAEDDLDEEDKLLFGGVFNIEVSQGFKFLDGLKGKGQIPEERIEELKGKLRSLHGNLRQMNGYERTLMRKCKGLATEVHQQRVDMDRSGLRQFSDNSEIGELKREYVKVQNEANLALERETKLSRDIEDAQRFKQELIDDIEEIRKHKSDMLEPQLIAATKEIKLEVLQRQHQHESLLKDLEEKDNTYELVLKERDRLEIEKEKHSIALAKATEMPAKIIKQSDVLRDAINSLISENSKQTIVGQQLEKDFDRLQKKRKDMEDLKLDGTADFEQKRGEIHEMERACDDVFREHGSSKDNLSFQKLERVRLEIAVKKVGADLKREHDIFVRTIREKEVALKNFRRLTTTANNIKQMNPAIRTQGEEFKRQLEANVRDCEHFKTIISGLKDEIDIAMYDFLQSEQTERSEKETFVQVMSANKVLEDNLEAIIAKYHSLVRDSVSLSIEKEIRARDMVKVQNKYRGLREDLKVKSVSIEDAEKRCQESTDRLTEFSQLYDVVKTERNKYFNLIQATHQRGAEMKEKIRILSNEVEILRHEISLKDNNVSRKKQENSSAYAIRDTVKNEANKSLAHYREKREEIDQHLSRIETLNTLINAAEEDMLNLKRRYEGAVKDRNTVGIHLLDRNDELCILYEKLNIQDDIMNRGEKELGERDEDMRKLKVGIQELEREIDLRRRRLPAAQKHNEAINSLNKELDSVRHEVVLLSARMEDPHDTSRVRILDGKDSNQKELLEKIAKMEKILAVKEEKLLEKDLVLDEVDVLTQRLKKQTLDGREETAEVAQNLNELTKKIKHVTKAMMARVSELSMHQAMAMTLYQEKCEKEALFETASGRLESGEAPTEEIELELERTERRRHTKEREMQKMIIRKKKHGQTQVEIDEDEFYLLNAIRTKAEPRPNAYIPSSGLHSELPIPKPYGQFAPFRPSETGAQMRHFKKPITKPIEI